MHRLKGEHSLKLLCSILNVNRSSYYKHYGRPEPARTAENRKIRNMILRIYSSHSKRPGAYKMQHLLEREYGIRISAGGVYRLMKGMDLPKIATAKPRKAHEPAGQDSECKNHLRQNFRWERPNSAWCSDFTYLRTSEGWAYLCVVIDLFSRKVISWSLARRHSAELVSEAFMKAFNDRGRPEGLLFHSDRGSEYSSSSFRMLLDRCSVLQSFSAKGYPYDNSVCESFFRYLKKEQTDRFCYRTFAELRASLFEYIDGYYNSRRLHSAIGYRTPNEFEKLYFDSL